MRHDEVGSFTSSYVWCQVRDSLYVMPVTTVAQSHITHSSLVCIPTLSAVVTSPDDRLDIVLDSRASTAEAPGCTR